MAFMASLGLNPNAPRQFSETTQSQSASQPFSLSYEGGGLRDLTTPNNPQLQILPNLRQGFTTEEFRARAQQMLHNIEDSVRRSRPTNLTENGGLFNNRPSGQNSFGLPPPPNASIFTNSIPSTHHVGLASLSGGSTLPNRGFSTGGNSTFTAGRQNLQNLNSSLAQPINPSQTTSASTFGQGFSFSNQIDRQPSAFSGRSSSIQTLNNRLNPPLVNSNNTPSTTQPLIFSNNLAKANTSAFPTNQLQTQIPTVPSVSLIDSKVPVQQDITKNTIVQPQDKAVSKDEEEEDEYEEEEVLEDDPNSATFAEDLQDLMANHQVTAPGDLFSNDTFTQNLVQFFKNYKIKAPRNKVLYRATQE